MKKLILLLLMSSLAMAILAEQIRVLPELISPSKIDCDNERIFILDGITVYVYSLKNQVLLKKFGKEGEGPGELMTQPDLPVNMLLYKNLVILNSFNKMVYFSKDGQFLKEKRVPFLVSQIIPLEENYVISKFTRRNDGSSQISVLLMDENLTQIKEVYKNDLLNDQGRGKIAWPLLNIFIQIRREKLFVFDQQKGFHVDVYDNTGKKLSEIKKSYDKIRITDIYKKEKMAWIKLQPAFRDIPEEIKNMVYFLDFLPAMDYCLVRDNKIYIQTSRTNGDLAEFYILDFSGTVLQKIFLPNARQETIRLSPAANYTFHDDQYYYLQENEEEEWELHVMAISPSP